MAVQSGTRIQKVMSDMGVTSRRKAEEYIEQGRVQVNGRKAVIGMRIDPKRDIITLDGERVGAPEGGKKYYLAMYKPRGYVTTMSDELGRKTIVDLLSDCPVRVYPVGRLDKQSEGLLLLTNDGAFANMMTHPSHEVTKVYRATVDGIVKEEQLISLAEGVVIDGSKTLPAQVKVITSEAGRTVLEMVIREGRNRQIRKMCEAVGLTVKRLRRTMVGPVKLSMLKPGDYRELTGAELLALRSMSAKNVRRDTQDKAEHNAKENARMGVPKRGMRVRTATGRPRAVKPHTRGDANKR
ncbi:MAG: pseudouridine synthase [Acetanaerobacterium sp.]